MKDDERALLVCLWWSKQKPREIPFEPKRRDYILGKWAAKGWYEWGTVIDLGWLTPAGVTEAIRRSQF